MNTLKTSMPISLNMSCGYRRSGPFSRMRAVTGFSSTESLKRLCRSTWSRISTLACIGLWRRLAGRLSLSLSMVKMGRPSLPAVCYWTRLRPLVVSWLSRMGWRSSVRRLTLVGVIGLSCFWTMAELFKLAVRWTELIV